MPWNLVVAAFALRRGSAVRFRAREMVATVARAATPGPSAEPLPFAFQLSAFELAWTPIDRFGSPGVPITYTYPPAEP
jgi:hypothetical protein